MQYPHYDNQSDKLSLSQEDMAICKRTKIQLNISISTLRGFPWRRTVELRQSVNERKEYLQSYDPTWLTATESHDSKCAGNSLHFILVMQTRNIESWCKSQSSLPASQAVLSGLNYHFADSDDLLQPNNAVQLSNQKLEKTKILTSEFSYQKIEVIK